MSPSTLLLIIDAQIDFCSPIGSLFVPGADKDVERIVHLLKTRSEAINDVIVTLDSHQVLDISHPGFWTDRNGNHPKPFTTITSGEAKKGNWTPIWEKEWVANYLDTLEKQGEFSHFIWPEHCVLGTTGHALEPILANSLAERAREVGKNHLTVVKGLNPFTEHFGIFEAQVPNNEDPDTRLNQQLLAQLSEFDRILICGEARSHCIATSIKQAIKYAPELLPRIVLLTDCMSDVPGMGNLADPIYALAEKKGIRFAISSEI